MIERETIVVGGGPAGSSAAWRLGQHHRQCLVLDREAFPREKLCAGWITPEVLEDLQFTATDYPHRFLTFDALKISLWRLPLTLHSPQHSIRRFEFDAWLLQRSGAEVIEHEVRQIEDVGDGFELDGRYRCRYLIGAGGTRCPVYRALFRPLAPRRKSLQAVALELEFPYAWRSPHCHLWFLNDGLPGYSWYVPKADGYINIGVGGMAAALKRSGDDIRRHWDALVKRLGESGLLDAMPGEPRGYSYFLRDEKPMASTANAFLAGDAWGLATRDMCEGIGPAVRSGLIAAETIVGDTTTERSIGAFTAGVGLVRRGLEWRFTGGRFKNKRGTA